MILDPEGGIIGELDALVGIELVDRAHEAHIAFLHEIEHVLHPAALKVHGNAYHKPQMGGNQPEGGIGIVVVPDAQGQFMLLLGLEQGKAADLPQVEVQAVPAARLHGQAAFGRCGQGLVVVRGFGQKERIVVIGVGIEGIGIRFAVLQIVVRFRPLIRLPGLDHGARGQLFFGSARCPCA